MAKINFERMTPEQRQRFFSSLIDTVKQMVETFNKIHDYPPPPESAA